MVLVLPFLPLFGILTVGYTFVFGIVVIVQGKAHLTQKWTIQGIKARAVGLGCVFLGIALLALFLIFMVHYYPLAYEAHEVLHY